MVDSPEALRQDLEAVQQISFVPSMLEVICQITGMGFAAVARVTSDRWVACSVRDEVQFGLKEGGELQIATTLCNEIRDHRQPIIINDVAQDTCYHNHHTPRIYNLQSYISFPILLKNGEFFGTLCAISSRPAQVNNKKVIDTFTMFAELLSFHLQSLDLLERSYHTNRELVDKNKALTLVNNDLDTIVYTASHDLKSPLVNMEGLLQALSYNLKEENLNREEINQIIRLMQSSLKRFKGTLRDLTTLIETDNNSGKEITAEISWWELVGEVKQDLNKLIAESQAIIEIAGVDKILLSFSRKNYKSILYNLISNALKYRSPDRAPHVRVQLEQVAGRIQLTITDNGLGIPREKQEKIFNLFQRLHSHVEGSGLGLFIVHRLVTRMKGKIQVKSTVNQGTTFTILL